jgi:hypothetical protein
VLAFTCRNYSTKTNGSKHTHRDNGGAACNWKALSIHPPLRGATAVADTSLQSDGAFSKPWYNSSNMDCQETRWHSSFNGTRRKPEPQKSSKTRRDPDMLDEYDFSKGVRGKYAKRHAEGTNIVVLSPDVAEVFHDSESVNEALRVLVKIARQKTKKVSA